MMDEHYKQFIQELLKYGDAVEVLKPQWLRDHMAAIAAHMNEKYQREKNN